MKIAAADIRQGRAVDPGALLGYLRVNGWTQLEEYRRETFPVALLMERDGAEVQVPLVADARDYAWLVARLVNFVGEVEKRPPHQVLADFRLFRTDVVRLRRTGRDDASLPLADGAAIFSVAQNLMIAASLAASSEPRQSYSGRRPKAVTKFLSEAMLGQTEPGSFVVRVLVPLPPQVGGTQGNFSLGGSPPIEPFGRKVTKSLSAGLEATRRAVVSSFIENTLEPFRVAVEHGVSAEFCRALSQAGGSDSEGGVEIAVSWGMSVPRPRVEPVFFPNDHLPVLKQAADFLAETQSREDFELEGYITKLARDKQTEGDVTIAATVDGQLLKVLVRLPSHQYKVAADAHTADFKVSVLGELSKEGRQYRLVEPRHLRVIAGDDVGDD